jgi:phage FluMu protein Com
LKINLDKDEPQSRSLRCRKCNSLLFRFTARLDVQLEYDRPERLDIDTGDVLAAVQIKCRCKTYNNVIFRDETLAARPPSVYEHPVLFEGAHRK